MVASLLLGGLRAERRRQWTSAARGLAPRARLGCAAGDRRLVAGAYCRASTGSEGATVQRPSSQSRLIASIGSEALTTTDEPAGGATPSSHSDTSRLRRSRLSMVLAAWWINVPSAA